MAHITQGSVQYLDSGFWTRLWTDDFQTNVELYIYNDQKSFPGHARAALYGLYAN